MTPETPQEAINRLSRPITLQGCEIRLTIGKKYTIVQHGHKADGWTGTLEWRDVGTRMAWLDIPSFEGVVKVPYDNIRPHGWPREE